MLTPPLKTLSSGEYEQLLASGKMLERFKTLGPKVVKLPGGEYLKMFTVKSLFSKYRFVNPAQRFAANAERLQQLGIPVLQVQQVFAVQGKPLWGVRYRGLPGTPLRDLLKQGEVNEALLNQLAVFIKSLHDKGVYFRSLHFGNIVLTPDGQFGLIDFLDCYFKKPLNRWQRRRNFAHLFRYDEAATFEGAILAAYQP